MPFCETRLKHSWPAAAIRGLALAAAWRNIAMLLVLRFAFTSGGALGAQEDLSPHSRLTVISGVKSVHSGQRLVVVLRLELDAGWHTYWTNPGDAGLPLGVAWRLAEGAAAGPVQFPTPHLTPQPPLMSYGYEGVVFLPVVLTVPKGIAPGKTFHAEATADWLACADVCLPASGEISFTLPVVADGEAQSTDPARKLIDSSLARIPSPVGAWRASARATADGYVLTVTPERKGAPALPSPYFFVDSSGILEHAKPQPVERTGDTLRFKLSRSEFASGTSRILRGVLVADKTIEHSRGWQVEAAVEGISGTSTNAVAVEPVVGQSQPAQSLALVAALGFAFLGGLILNLMPCVFPVLSIKVLTFVEQGAHTPGAGPRHGMVFAAGVLAASWVLSGVLFALRATGDSLGWGFQMQSPIVVAILSIVMFGLALNMSGVFEIGMALTRLGGVGRGRGYADSFLTGILAVVVATPCTAPFMGAAIGFALVQPAVVGMLVMTSLAMGLALPYVILSSVPALLRYLPRPGAWLDTFKQLLAFPLYATVVWLVWVLGQQAGVNAVAQVLLALVVLAFGAWMYGRAQRSTTGRIALSVAGVALCAAIALGVLAGRTEPQRSVATDAEWEPFSAARVAVLRSEGRPIFVDFTAAWCLSCQVNERVALRTAAVRAAFKQGNVALLRADWTARDADIAAALAVFGRNGVPLYVLYGPNATEPARILPTVLTSGIVIDAIEALRKTAQR